MTKLVQRKKGDNVFTVSFHDKQLAGGVPINESTFGLDDRIYDSKGLETMFIKLSNIGANTLDYVIQATQVEFTSLSDLVDADFSKELQVEASINAANSVEFTEDLMGPEITAVRIRLKSASGTTLLGIVSAD